MSDRDLIKTVQAHFKKLSDPQKAVEMAAYMKTDMPFYGVQKPDRLPVYREIKKRFRPSSAKEYQSNVRALWKLPHREEKYAALEYARFYPEYVNTDSMPMYEELIRDGAWWDFVDVIAIDLVGTVLLNERSTTRDTMEEWVEDDDIWIRRTAIISHNHHKKSTDWKQLSKHCLLRCSEREFFIRKAIGWALREYSYTDPQKVKDFLITNESKLSPLSYREGAKQLVRSGQLK